MPNPWGGGKGPYADTNEHRHENLKVEQVHKTLSGRTKEKSFHIAILGSFCDARRSRFNYAPA
jgi:hypothetical protein